MSNFCLKDGQVQGFHRTPLPKFLLSAPFLPTGGGGGGGRVESTRVAVREFLKANGIFIS